MSHGEPVKDKRLRAIDHLADLAGTQRTDSLAEASCRWAGLVGSLVGRPLKAVLWPFDGDERDDDLVALRFPHADVLVTTASDLRLGLLPCRVTEEDGVVLWGCQGDDGDTLVERWRPVPQPFDGLRVESAALIGDSEGHPLGLLFGLEDGTRVRVGACCDATWVDTVDDTYPSGWHEFDAQWEPARPIQSQTIEPAD